MKDIKSGKDKPASSYDPQIKNFGKQTGQLHTQILRD